MLCRQQGIQGLSGGRIRRREIRSCSDGKTAKRVEPRSENETSLAIGILQGIFCYIDFIILTNTGKETEQMEKCRENVKRWVKLCFEGELTMPKATFWLVAAVCLLTGVVYGLKTAPRTHGIQKNYGCNNGNNNGNDNGNGNSYCGEKECCCKEDEEEEQAVRA